MNQILKGTFFADDISHVDKISNNPRKKFYRNLWFYYKINIEKILFLYTSNEWLKSEIKTI